MKEKKRNERWNLPPTDRGFTGERKVIAGVGLSGVYSSLVHRCAKRLNDWETLVGVGRADREERKRRQAVIRGAQAEKGSEDVLAARDHGRERINADMTSGYARLT